MSYQTKASGTREVFITGSQRDNREGKGRYDLVSPLALKRLAGVYERGARKYSDRNWEKGQPVGRVLDSAIRHIFQYMEGFRDEDHLAQAAWNIFAAIHFEEMVKRGLLPKELLDLPGYMAKEEVTALEDEMKPVSSKQRKSARVVTRRRSSRSRSPIKYFRPSR